MRLMIHTIRVGDHVTMIGPDGAESEPFVLAEPVGLRDTHVWLYREYDAPIVVERCYGLESAFRLYGRRGSSAGSPHPHG